MRLYSDLDLQRNLPGGIFLMAVVGAASVIGTVGLVVSAALRVSALPVIWLMMTVLAVGFAWRLLAMIRQNDWPSLLGCILGLLPMLFLSAVTPARHWDDFMTWLPSAEYIYLFKGLPVIGGPPTISVYPGYPPGMPLLLTSAWTFAGHFINNAGGVINVASLAVLAGLVVSSGFDSRRLSNLGLFTRGVVFSLVVTLGNAGIAWSTVLSSLPDTLTAVSVASLAWLAVRFWIVGKIEDRAALWPAAIFGLILGFLLTLRQTGLVLAVMIALAVLFVSVIRNGWRQARPFPNRWEGLFLVLGPGFSVLLAWRVYVTFWLPNAKEFHVLPISEWNWNELPSTFAAIAGYAVEHWGLSLVCLSVAIYGIRYLFGHWKDRLTDEIEFDEVGALAGVFAIIWSLNSCFLMFCYLAAFKPDEALRAAEVLRYQSHVMEFGLVVACILLVRVVRLPNVNASGRLHRLALPAVLCGSLVANILTRPAPVGDIPVLLRYAAGCDCAFLSPQEVDATGLVAEKIRDKLRSNFPDSIAIEFDNDSFAPGLVNFVVRWSLWQNDPLRPWNVFYVWSDEPDAKQKIETATVHIRFLTQSTHCKIEISQKNLGVWELIGHLQAPEALHAHCRS